MKVGSLVPAAPESLIAPTRSTGLSKRWLRLRVYTALLVIDCALILASFLVANLVRYGTGFASPGLNIAIVLIPVYVMVAGNRGIYSSGIFSNWRRNASLAAVSFTIAAVAVLLICFYVQASELLSREIFTIGVIISAGGLFTSRKITSKFALSYLGGQPNSQVFISDGVFAPIDFTASIVDAATLGIVPDIRNPHMLDKLAQLLNRADRVIIGCPPERRAAWAMVLKGANINGEIMAPEIDQLGAVGAGSIAGRSTLVISCGPLDMHNRALKRLLDVSLAGAAIFALAPLMCVAAIMIKLDSPGPVFFRQQRLGRGNRLFQVYKFRSMRNDLCDADGAQSTQRGDARVTRVGRFIRATSIDELPQILNVLKGDMSIVGPRPHALGSLAGDKLFWEVDQRYWHRHAAKPGITGLAQVRGFRGATHLQSDLVDRLQADLDYLSGWTIWRDISIIVATFKVILHRNAF